MDNDWINLVGGLEHDFFYPIVGMMIQSDQYFSGGWNHQLDIEQGKSMEHQNGWDNPRFSSIFHGEYTMLPPEFGAEHRHFLKITIFEALWISILKTNQNLVNWKFSDDPSSWWSSTVFSETSMWKIIRCWEAHFWIFLDYLIPFLLHMLRDQRF